MRRMVLSGLSLLAIGALASSCVDIPEVDTGDAVQKDVGSPDSGDDIGGTDTPDVVTNTDAADTDPPPVCKSNDDCPQGDDPCVTSVCTAAGLCELQNADGAPCDDGDACTVDDVCKGGACQSGDTMPDCTGPCTSNDQCKPGTWCMADTCDGEGACQPVPDGCPEIYAPVCGCDNATYGNSCEASSASVNVAFDGPCECASVACAEGTVAVDTNGNGCEDSCLATCANACDCYENAAIGFGEECGLDCLGCGNFWACDGGYCAAKCDAIPEEIAACVAPTGCKSNDECDKGSYCQKKDTDCAGLGKCSPKPEVCPLVLKPVCSCEGTTWGNACEAAQNGQNVASAGACDEACGGIAGLPCADGQYCAFKPGSCDVADSPGTCVGIPELCPDVWAPVCGCDGETYGNHCELQAASGQLDHDGACDCMPILCNKGAQAIDTDGDGCDDACVPCPELLCLAGSTPADTDGDGCDDACVPVECKSNGDCGEGLYCKQKSCDGGAGICAAIPDGCPEIWAPVCGCDGTTYGNDCEAAAAGMNVASKGECSSVCGTIVGIPCGEGQFCDLEGGCLISDAGGLCVDVPEFCPKLWDPVCGCDGETYPNDCARIKAGITLDHKGQCSCTVIIDCKPGFEAIDTDGDGCGDTCQPIECKTNKDCGSSPFGLALYCKKNSCDGTGTCALKPTVCTKELAPVCSCTGKTFDNACFAAMAGETVASDGPCDSSCGGKMGLVCEGPNQFCEFEPGTCKVIDNLGTCVDKPDGCIALYDPVCGCDGKTYGNDCNRQQAGVSKAYDGACACEANTDCNDGDYCQKKGCGGPGSCAPMPDKCVEIYKPVCGCDGKTWSNSCFAAAAGVNIASYGECDPIATKCGSNTDCAKGEYCNKKDGNCGGSGQCAPLPEACTLEYDPVCGCDNKTYGNGCAAALAGVSVKHAGQCESVCAGFAGILCPKGQWCDLEPGTCSWADQQGLCVDVPDACTKEYAPVCGCDGTTYDNDCFRLKAGAQKDHDGTCDCKPILCKEGSTPVDTDGDGCDETCLPCPLIKCAAGTVPTDTNGDGCFDSCLPTKCESNPDCGDGTYCKKEAGSCKGGGICTVKPDLCTEEYNPVCGCSGKTWSNPCMAAAGGDNIASKGECKTVCGGFIGLACEKGQLCELPEGTCGTADMQGVCVDIPAGCPDVWDPVCGCDGKTYSNDCDRLAAGAQKDHDGACGCSIVIDCLPGFLPFDSDGDGCADSCKPAKCETDADCGGGKFGSYCNKDAGDCKGVGTCAVMPDLCTKEYAPVCSCDGKTYDNACFAAMAGANVASKGACSLSCGGLAEIACPKGQFCEYTDGTCGAKGSPGMCVTIPDACLTLYDPVCGCGNTTYANDCVRQLAGVSKLYDGACKCNANADCPDDAYCATKGDCDGLGTCEKKPNGCIDLYDPVCGCDGKTYGNACAAAAAGANVASKGACGGGEKKCASNKDCASFDGTKGFCKKATGSCDGVGTCEDTPKGCPDVWDPVCGCDGKTYGNSCEAWAVSMNIAHEGECKAPGCSSNDDCADGNFCAKETGDCKGIGTCKAIPEACIEIYAPVCGCDGKTYSNSCFAAAAGVNVAAVGKCEPTVTECKSNADCASADGTATAYCKKATCDGIGHCTPKPEACFDLWAPVCGCNGKTYGNDCEAAAAGVNVAYKGECKPTNVSCTTDADCVSSDGTSKGYCQKKLGNCEGFGICAAKPELCTKEYNPVCGCDGITYGNDCMAAAAGANVASLGVCPTGGEPCKDDAGCADGSYCEKELGACDDGLGKCTKLGAACDVAGDFDTGPVCGCDGTTYKNVCAASLEGVNVASKGECKPTGCASNKDCALSADGADGSFCAKAKGDCDGDGTCASKPTACPDVYAPVCGCDGKTYGNSCEAAAAGVNVKHDGKCALVGADCSADKGCPDGQYCNQKECDGAGTCQTMPELCPLYYAPVCGCDGKTYGNGCEAASVGVSVAHDGPCEIVTGCSSNADCKSTLGVPLYCHKGVGDCDGKGTCDEVPGLCTKELNPVCGCDGNTYGNGCLAAAAGATIKHFGSCACDIVIDCVKGFTPVDTDGDGCVDSCKATCESACDCYKVDGLDFEKPCAMLCPTCDNFWTCSDAGYCEAACGPVPPELSKCECPAILCEFGTEPTDTDGDGCDDTCKPVPTFCGGIAGFPCKDGQWCDPDAGFCNGADIAGTCVETPEFCDKTWKPVCGCDGKTYPNDCSRILAMVAKDHDGECEGCKPILCEIGTKPTDTDGDGCPDSCVPDFCGGIAGIPCDDGQWCDPAAGFCFGADIGGTCVETPELCDKTWKPVCGCDGKTYPNDCSRIVAMIAKDHDGECKGCPPIACKDPKIPADTDGDGCDDTCVCGTAIKCAPGYLPKDTDGDGCDDTCVPNGETCGGFIGVPCPTGQWCDPEPGYCFGADISGICVTPTGLCAEIYKPVCGCDGKTYSNDCTRIAAKVAKDHEGACKCGIVIDCLPGFKAVDTDGDGCEDACKATCADACDCYDNKYLDFDGICPLKCLGCGNFWSCSDAGFCEQECGFIPDEAKKCTCTDIVCEDGTFGVDTDGDGCKDKCQCAIAIDCLPGFAPYDSTGNGCADTCKATCAGACDCYDNKYLEFDGICPLKCAGCGNYWSCSDAGFCEQECGFIPDEVKKCTCTDIVCEDGTFGVDTDGDGCKDKCQCAIAIDCMPGFVPFDSTGNGCPDTCKATCKSPCDCYDNANLDFEGDCPLDCATCDNYWTCSDAGYCEQACGPVPEEIKKCTCKTLLCPDGGTPTDTDGDGCDDTCVTKPKVCGGIIGIPCDDGQWCDPSPGFCSGADIGGLCVATPELCDKTWKPVCGCNGETYPNDCARIKAMIAKDYDGECKITAGCTSNDQCKSGQYCAKAAGDCKGTGACSPMPEACLLLWDPVCGCDNKTYSNGCVAASAGMQVSYKGECKLSPAGTD